MQKQEVKIHGITGKVGFGEQNEAGQRLTEFYSECAVHRKHPLPTTQETTQQMDTTKIRLIIFFAAKDGEALYSQKKTSPGADCGSDHELLIVKFRVVKILI